MNDSSVESRRVVSIRVDGTSYSLATQHILDWAHEGSSRFVCAANVHVTMEAFDNSDFARIINSADMVTPDGMPLVWALRLLGVKKASRVYGPDLTLAVCDASAKAGIPIGLFGASPECLQDFSEFLRSTYPAIKIACAISPPFRELTEDEEREYASQISESGARILLVGLGCPKQEKWIFRQVGRIPAVMMGVGAAFDFHAGKVIQAPRWMMRIGMEWLFRMLVEPRRLWKRYVIHNPRYVILLLWQLVHGKKY